MTSDAARQYVAEARQLTEGYKAGTKGSVEAFRKLVQLLLKLTVMRGGASVTISDRPESDRESGQSREVYAITGIGRRPLPLRDGRYLNVYFNLRRDPAESGHGHRLKVVGSSFCYQVDELLHSSRWVFRYDYLRYPHEPYPGGHLHVRAKLDEEGCLPKDKLLERIHFPTARVSLEAVLRLLIEDFKVPARENKSVWRPVLTCAEEGFREIAHQAASGPSE